MIYRKKGLAMLSACVLLSACVGNGDEKRVDGDLFMLTDTNNLVSIQKTNPSSVLTSVTLNGFATSGEAVIGIDFRPFNRKLYAVTKDTANAGRLYTVNIDNGALTFVARLTADTVGDPNGVGTPTQLSPQYTSLSGNTFGVDFNPMADALRVVSDTGQNLRIFLDNDQRTPQKAAGLTITDGALSAGAGTSSPFAATAAAYTNGFDGATSTRLFNLDTSNNTLVLQNSANDGVLINQGPLGVSGASTNGFDIDPTSNIGYAVLAVGGTKSLYSVRIPGLQDTVPATANAASKIADLNLAGNVIGLAVRGNANPIAIGLTGTLTAPSLVSFSPRSPSVLSAPVNVTGLATGDQLLAIDQRPANGLLYGLVRNGSTGKIYTLNPTTGAARLVSTLTNSNAVGASIVISAGKQYAIDFNPVADRLRVVSSAINAGAGGNGENYRVNVETGGTIIESEAVADAAGGALRVSDVGGVTPADANFNVLQLAYTNNYAATTRPTPATELFDVDANNNQLLEQDGANTGKLHKAGTGLGQSLTNYAGFDIAGGDNGLRLLAARTTGAGPYTLFDVNLQTGVATPVANLLGGATSTVGGAGGPSDLRDIAIQ